MKRLHKTIKNNFLFRIEQEIRIFLWKPFYPPELFEHDPDGGTRAVYVGYFERKEDLHGEKTCDHCKDT